MFEQFKKNVKVNKKEEKELTAFDKNKLVISRKKTFFTGLIRDLIEHNSFDVA